MYIRYVAENSKYESMWDACENHTLGVLDPLAIQCDVPY